MSKLQISDSLLLMESAGFVYGTSGTELVEYHEAASEPIRKLSNESKEEMQS